MFILPEEPLLPRPGLYRFVNLVNGKSYVGITKNVIVRVCRHARGIGESNWAKAVRKCGAEQFRFEVPAYSIAEKPTDEKILEWLIPAEADWILMLVVQIYAWYPVRRAAHDPKRPLPSPAEFGRCCP
jgi:hypothetical protein